LFEGIAAHTNETIRPEANEGNDEEGGGWRTEDGSMMRKLLNKSKRRKYSFAESNERHEEVAGANETIRTEGTEETKP
jgi:hypothetical protein